MYKPIRKADLIIGGTAVKQGEIFTLGFQLFDANGLVIVPSVGQTISVKIANKTGVVFETTAVVVSDHIEFTVDENIGAGKMRVELTVSDGANVLQKYPANGYIELYITASLDDIGTGTIYTVTAAEMFTRIEGSEVASAEAVATAGEAVVIAEGAVETADAVRADFDLVVAEAGSSNPEVVLARGGEATLQARLDKTNQQLAEKSTQSNLKFKRLLETGQISKIKLIGDSITEGVASTGHVSPPPNTQPLIFDSGTAQHYEGGYTARSFANLFRDYMTANYPTIPFTNAGIGGKSAKWGNANKQFWVSDTEDAVFVMLGTNDRWDNATIEEFKTNLEQFLAYVHARSKIMVVMTATPTLNDHVTETYNFGMKEVDKVITEVCMENNYVHVSLYREFLKYANIQKIPFNSAIEHLGTHPIDKGYKIIWMLMQQATGLIDSTLSWEDSTPTDIVRLKSFGINDPIRFYQTDKFTICLITAGHPDAGTLPEVKKGILITFRTSESDAFSWQEFIVSDSKNRYIRFSNGAYSNSWNAWQNISPGQFNTLIGANITKSTALSYFPKDTMSTALIGNSHTGLWEFPEGLAGALLTYRFSESDVFSYQVYTIYQSVKTYKRYWTGSAWSTFVKVSAV